MYLFGLGESRVVNFRERSRTWGSFGGEEFYTMLFSLYEFCFVT